MHGQQNIEDNPKMLIEVLHYLYWHVYSVKIVEYKKVIEKLKVIVIKNTR
jgi:hypothetical protein